MYTEYLANPLVLALTKVTALLLLALAGALLIKRPAARATLLTCTMIASPLILALSFTRPLIDVIPAQTTAPQIATSKPEHAPVPEAISREPSVAHTPSELSANVVTPAPATHTAPKPELPVLNNPKPDTHTSVIYAVCATGTIIMLLPLLISSWKILRLQTSSASGRPLEIWNNICRPIRKQYRLLFTSSPSAPFAHGIVHPKVLLPNKSTKWSDQKLHATLTHEAAHLHRRDPLTRIASFVVRAIFWFHPLVWIAHRQLIQAQEESCDQIALSSGIAAEDYAEELLASASHATRTPQDALAMARWSQMGKRIHRIINQPTNNTTTMKTTLTIATVTASTALILATTGVAQETTPPETTQKRQQTTPTDKKLTRIQSELQRKSDKLALRQLAAKQLYEAEREKDQLEFQINKLLAVKDKDLPSIAAELPDVGFREAYNKYEEAKRELQVARASGLSEKHPDILMRKTRIEELRKGLEKRAVNVRESLKHRLALLQGRVKKMRELRDQQQADLIQLQRLYHAEKAKLAVKTQENVKPAELLIHVRSDGSFTSAGKKLTHEQLLKHLKDLAAAKPNAAAVRIRANRQVEYKKITEIIDICQKAGIDRVSFAVQAKDEKVDKVSEIRKRLYAGEGYYNLGKYDEAEAEYRKALQTDPHNTAARRWLEKIASTKADYYRAAYDHTRSRLLKEVDGSQNQTITPATKKRTSFSIGGHVRKPNMYQCDTGLTLFDAIALAGGVDKSGSRARIKLIRGSKTYTYDLKRDDHKRIKIHPGDMIEVQGINAFGR